MIRQCAWCHAEMGEKPPPRRHAGDPWHLPSLRTIVELGGTQPRTEGGAAMSRAMITHTLIGWVLAFISGGMIVHQVYMPRERDCWATLKVVNPAIIQLHEDTMGATPAPQGRCFPSGQDALSAAAQERDN